MWASLFAVMMKEIRQTARDRRMMGLLLVAPILQLFVFGNAADLDVDHVPTIVVDQDATGASREHLRRMFADGTLERVDTRATAEEATSEIVRGHAAAAVIIPRGFSRRLARGAAGMPAQVQVIVDGSDPNRSAVAGSAVARFFGDATLDVIEARRARMGAAATALHLPDVELRPRVLYNPHLETAISMVPGIASMLLLIITTIVMAMGLAREREIGTLEQILVTPVQPAVLLVGKMLPFAMIGLFDFILAMVVGAYVFDVPLRGSFVLLIGATLLYLMSTLSAGLLISTVSNTQQQAFMTGFLFMMPAALLSGITTPIRSMPAWLQPLTMVNPLRHYTDVLRAVLVRGAGFDAVAPQLAILAAFGVVLATVASLRFRKTVE
ncbi:MAG: ABC transporter permease [Sandaracinus sp.]